MDVTERLWVCEPDDVSRHPFARLVEAVGFGDVAALEDVLALASNQMDLLQPSRPLPPSFNPVVIHACLRGEHDILEILLDRFPETLRAEDAARGASLLHWAAHTGNPGIISMLLRRDASLLRALDAQGMAPVHFAALSGRRCALAALLSGPETGDVDVRTASEPESTPLLLAAARGHAHCVQYLISRGASIEAVDSMGRTALLEAALGGHTRVVRLLMSAGANPRLMDAIMRRTALHWASTLGDVDMARLLLASAPELVHLQDSEGETALFLSTRRGHDALVDVLMDSGADAGVPNAGGVTPLMVASLFGHLPVVLRLVKSNDAELEIPGPLGRTPLHYAALGGHAEVVAVLLQAGARVDVLDTAGRSPLDLAADMDAVDVMQLFK